MTDKRIQLRYFTGDSAHIVGRCHVGQSYVAVIKYFVSRMKKGAWKGLSRAQRKVWMRHVIKAHKANRGLYSAVMSGRV